MADNIILNPQQQIEEQLKKVREQTQGLFSSIEKEGLTSNAGSVLIKPGTINAGEISDASSLPSSLPYNAPKDGLSAITNIGADAGSLVAFYQAQALEDQKRIDELAKERDKLVSPTVNAAGALNEANAQFNVPGLSDDVKRQSLKVAQLKGEVDKLDIERTVEIDRAYAQIGVGMRFIEGQVGEINRKFDIKKAYASANLGAEATLLQAQVGNLDLANNMVKDVVNAYTFDIQAKRQDIETLRNNYSDLINDLTTDQKNALNDLANRLEKEETTTKAEKTQVMGWGIKYNQYGAGITINDTAEEAYAKITPDVLAKSEATTTNFPTSFEEWILAGGEEGTGKTYAEFITKRDSTLLSPTEAEKLGVPYGTTQEEAANKIATDNALQQAKDSGMTREQIEARILEDNDATEMPPDIKARLDILFPPQNWWQKFWDIKLW